MYVAPRHQPQNQELLAELIHTNPLAAIVIHDGRGLDANHIPLLFDEDAGLLCGHVSVANELASLNKEVDTLALFQGPQSYISPSWCPSKLTNPEIVPTWNYAVVHVHGRLRVVHDEDWLFEHLEAMTLRQETSVGLSWKVSDAPPTYLNRMLKGIAGIEIRIERMTGKWKTTLMRPEENVAGVCAALRASGTDDASEMAELIHAWSTTNKANE